MQKTMMKSRSDEVIAEQKKQYYEVITDGWKYMKYYIEHLPATDDEWTAMIDTGNRMVEKHKELEQFALQVVMAAAEEIDRISKFKQVI